MSDSDLRTSYNLPYNLMGKKSSFDRLDPQNHPHVYRHSSEYIPGPCNHSTFVDNTVSCAADTFPTMAHCTDAPVLSVEAINDDEDFAQHACPRCDCHLPAHLRTSDFTSTDDSSRTSAHTQLLAPDPAPSNIEDTANALQQQGSTPIARAGAQPQATVNPNAPIDREPPCR